MDTISQFSLHDELHQRLRRMIIDGRFEPGDKIPERDLCAQFDVSRTPLREALKVLAAEGLVELSPNRGAIVASMSFEDFEECQTVSMALEALSGELACEAITDEEILDIKKSYDAMIRAHDEQDLAGISGASKQIHEKVVSAAHNPMLKLMYDSIFFRMSWSLLISRLARQSPETVLGDHAKIMVALEARNNEALGAALKSFLTHIFQACPDGRLPCEMKPRGERPS
jgi:DNA-binding GntR family transcriptional regulator